MRPGISAVLFLTGLAMLSPASAVAQRYGNRPAAASQMLRPGQFIWYEQPEFIRANTSAGSPISIVISIPSQLAHIYRGDMLVGVTTVSTGARGHATPVGAFTILQKNKFHRSNIYSNAPMPFMQRLTWTGIALHGGHLPGYPASHGCIRLPTEFARALFDMTRMGGAVSVIDTPIDIPPEAPAPKRWTPILVADTQGLGGESFNVVTMRIAVSLVQPLPPERRTSRPAPGASSSPEESGEIVQPLPDSVSR